MADLHLAYQKLAAALADLDAVLAQQFMLVEKYDPEQERDWHGRFAGPGGGGEAAALLKHPTETADQIVAKVEGAAARVAEARAKHEKVVRTDALVSEGGFKQPDGSYTPERAKLQDEILLNGKEGTGWKGFTKEQIAAATPPEGEKPTLYILGGRAGSGKSTFTKKDGPVDKSKAIYLNNDDLKDALPEYKGWNAAQLHEESSDMGKRAEQFAKEHKLNLILDATMKGGHFDQRIDEFKQAGYRVEGYYMYVHPAEATKRTLTRFMEGGEKGRFVPPEYTLASLSNEKNFDSVKGKMDKWALYDNNVPFGQKAKLVARSK